MGNLMATTAKVRGLEGTVIDGAVRDVTELRAIGHQVFSRRISPATSVGRMVSVSKQTPVSCADVMVNPGDYIVGDADGVVVVPQGAAADQVVALLKDYDARSRRWCRSSSARSRCSRRWRFTDGIRLRPTACSLRATGCLT